MKPRFEFIVSLTAMITAVIAIFVAVAQTRLMHEEADLMREHQRLSVKPSIYIGQTSLQQEEGHLFSYRVSNHGLGPAVIEDFTVRYRGTALANWREVFEAVTDGANDGASVPAIRGAMAPGHVIPAGKHIDILKMTNARKVTFALFAAGDELEISVCACSLYDECWRTTGLRSRPVAVRACRAGPDYFDSVAFKTGEVNGCHRRSLEPV